MKSDPFDLSCPAPAGDAATVQMAHGGGGRVMRRLLDEIILPAFSGKVLAQRHDSAVGSAGAARLAFTTDSYVVSPLFFPGGDIGKLAVCGTVNDLAMAGAKPLWLSAAFVLEEGLPLDHLRRIVASMREAAAEANVEIVTGDTKVVDRGKGDGIFITTSGVGLIADHVDILPDRVRPGDAILVSGDLGRHGVAILSVRQGIEFEFPLQSDCASLASLVAALIDAHVEIHCLRDLTRGGLASALNEIAVDAGMRMEIDEASVPVCEPVRGACELLGLDPLYVANEGRFVAFVPDKDADRALSILRGAPLGASAARVGTVQSAAAGSVVLVSRLGVRRMLDWLAGEQLPRIC